MSRASFVLLLCLAAGACAPGEAGPDADGGPTDGGGDDNGGDEPLFDVQTRELADLRPVAGRGLAVAVRGDGRFAIAFVGEGEGTFECETLVGEVEGGDNVAIVVAEEDGAGEIVTSVIDTVPGAATQALDLAVTPADELVVAYGGGEPANGYCGASDLAFARESGGGFETQIVATDSATPTPCRLDGGGEDAYCQIGDTVGLYPGIAVRDDGTVAISYQDFHNGFAEKDINGADLELARGAGGGFDLESISTEAGAGYHSAIAYGAGGRLILGHEVTGNNIFPDGQGGSYTLASGLYVVVEQDDGSFLEVPLNDRASTDHRVAVGHHPSVGWAAAYHDGGSDDVVFWTSTDEGATWIPEPADQVGLTGRSPQLGFLADGRPVLAYRYCGGPADGTCNPAVDRVRVAVRQAAGSWTKQDLDGRDEELEGLEVDMAVGADGRLFVISRNATREMPVLHVLTLR